MKRLLPALLGLAACVDSTGGDRFSFAAAAAGPADAQPGQPLTFTTPRGFAVTLSRAQVHVGAVYLNRSVPVSGAQATDCLLPGVYTAQVTTGLTFDALSPTPQPFPVAGDAIADHSSAGEVWLTGGDVNAEEDNTVVLDLVGLAQQGTATWPFEAKVHIGGNRAIPASDPAQPGAKPICKQRIVSPIAVDLDLRAGGSLLLRVDPRAMLAGVDFAELGKASPSATTYRFVDDKDAGSAERALFDGLRARSGTWSLGWQTGPQSGQ